MSKKKSDIADYVTARVAAQLLTIKHGRKIRPGYVCRVRSIGRIRVHRTMSLYLRADVEKAVIRTRNKKHQDSLES